MPSAPPIVRPSTGAQRPTVSDTRAPWIRRANSSRPRPSVPSQCRLDIGIRLSSMSMSVGLGSGNRSAKAAAPIMKSIQATAAQKSCPNRRARLLGAAARSSLMASSSVAMTDPGIEYRIKQIDDEIHQHEAARDKQYNALQYDQIPSVDCTHEEPADARQSKYGLHDHRSANQPSDVDAGNGDERQRRRFQRMHKENARCSQPLCLCQGDKILLQGGDHIGAKHSHDSEPFREREGERGQHHEPQISNWIFLERHVTRRREPAKL